ncbi:transcription termination factor, mitochondrial isoform X1 [Schistocerca cancellata]|uniref:transcription termination factor, mitochondrial isoform X1 n=1 Tax=Schistocerca cancellata TaxID=274614 RepID=UPI002118DD04|nr:transcription termination factor, mitochondrial isoform X1 [Schistocerca cancellata]
MICNTFFRLLRLSRTADFQCLHSERLLGSFVSKKGCVTRSAGNIRCHVSFNVDTDEEFNSDYISVVDKNYESRKIFCVNKLKDIFEISTDEAEKIYESHPYLHKLSPATIQNNAEKAQAQGLQKSVLQNNPWLLTFEEGKLKYSIQIVKRYHEDINKVVPLLKIPFHKLRIIKEYAQKDDLHLSEGSRIKYLSDKLQCPPSVISEALVKHDVLLSMPFVKLQTVMDLMLDAEIQPEDILKDLWIFRHSITAIKNRLSQAKTAEVPKIKPWMARCVPQTFQVTLRRHVQHRILLAPHSTVIDYLSERLECTPEHASYIMKRAPALQRTHISKLKRMIDFLYEEGFSAEQIRQIPRVLCHSPETVKIRLKELRMLGYNPSSLTVLCKSKRIYNSFVNKLLQKC